MELPPIQASRRTVLARWSRLAGRRKGPRFGDKGGFVAIVVGDLAFEPAIFAQIGPSGASDLIAFMGTIPVEVDPARGEPADHRSGERSKRYFAGVVGVDAQVSRAAKIKMLAPSWWLTPSMAQRRYKSNVVFATSCVEALELVRQGFAIHMWAAVQLPALSQQACLNS